ncbi:MAG: hypothetical protein ABSD99_01235 [Candidatus Bathyarchaeia archaeon]|jgi:hypothetical protein
MSNQLRACELRPKRLKIIWNWQAAAGPLVRVFPSTSFELKGDLSAIIAGRSVFAASSTGPSPLDFSAKVQKCLSDDDAGSFFLCGCLDYEFEIHTYDKDVLEMVKAVLDTTRNYPGFIQKLLEENTDQLLKKLGFSSE